MRKLSFILFLLLPLFCLSQQNLKKVRTKSWQTFVYKISALDAEQFHKWDSIPVSRFENS